MTKAEGNYLVLNHIDALLVIELQVFDRFFFKILIQEIPGSRLKSRQEQRKELMNTNLVLDTRSDEKVTQVVIAIINHHHHHYERLVWKQVIS